MNLCRYYTHACYSSSSTGALGSVASFVVATTIVTFLTCGHCRLHYHHLIDREETVHNLMRLSMGVASMWLLSNCMLTCIHPGIQIYLLHHPQWSHQLQLGSTLQSLCQF